MTPTNTLVPFGIRGQVRRDVNCDGDLVEVPADPGIAGVTITVLTGACPGGAPVAGPPPVNPTATDGSGNYFFEGLADLSTYCVVETDLAGYSSINDADGGTDNQITVPIAGSDVLARDFLDCLNTPTPTPTIVVADTPTPLPCLSRELNRCTDGVDNDCDGLVDCEDVIDCESTLSCDLVPTRTPIPTSTPRPTRTPITLCSSREINLCTDGLDNDCDGLIDCADTADCDASMGCPATPVPSQTPIPTSTLRPTRTPLPGETPLATNTPGPSRTPIPTSTLRPTRTPVFWTPTPTPTPKPGSVQMRLVAVGRVNPGSQLHYTVAIVLQKGIAPDVRLDVMLPQQVCFVLGEPVPDGTPAEDTCGGVVHYDLGDLQGPLSIALNVIARVRDDVTLGTKFIATAVERDGFGRSTTAVRLSRVGRAPRPKPSKARRGGTTLSVVAPLQVTAGGPVTYSLSASAARGAPDLTLTSFLPPGLRFVSSAPAPSFVRSDATGMFLEWRYGAVPAQALLRVVLNTQADAGLPSGTFLENSVGLSNGAGIALSATGTTMIK